MKKLKTYKYKPQDRNRKKEVVKYIANRQRTIRCVVCGREYALSDLRCPDCGYPAFFLSSEPDKLKKATKPYRKKTAEDIPKEERRATKKKAKSTAPAETTKKEKNKPIEKEPVITAKASKKEGVKQVENKTKPIEKKPVATPKTTKNKRRKTQVTDQELKKKRAALVVVLLLLIAAGVSFYSSISLRNQPMEGAFESYIAGIADNADSYDNKGHPIVEGVTSKVFYDGKFHDLDYDEVWKSYAIDDFDGDEVVEMMVLKECIDPNDTNGVYSLCMFEFSGGSVTAARETACRVVTNGDQPTGDFYRNAVLISHWNQDEMYYVQLFDDRFEEKYGKLQGKNTVDYVKNEENNYNRKNPSYYGLGATDLTLTPEEVEKELDELRTAEDGTILKPIKVKFKAIQVQQ